MADFKAMFKPNAEKLEEDIWAEQERSIGSVDESTAGNLLYVCNELQNTEQPIQWPSQSTEPVSSLKSADTVQSIKAAKIAEQKKKYASPTNIDDQPVGKAAEAEAEVAVPTYNFEQILEQALQSQGVDESKPVK